MRDSAHAYTHEHAHAQTHTHTHTHKRAQPPLQLRSCFAVAQHTATNCRLRQVADATVGDASGYLEVAIWPKVAKKSRKSLAVSQKMTIFARRSRGIVPRHNQNKRQNMEERTDNWSAVERVDMAEDVIASYIKATDTKDVDFVRDSDNDMFLRCKEPGDLMHCDLLSVAHKICDALDIRVYVTTTIDHRIVLMMNAE